MDDGSEQVPVGGSGEALPPRGWYPDPGDPAQLRWWDGAAWAEHVAPPAAGPVEPQADEELRTERRNVYGNVIRLYAAERG